MSDAAPTMRTGWVGADDALLALDRNGDGTISGRAEISFVDDVKNATSDLEGLVAYDTNEDGFLNAGDARFGEFLVWQDSNQDGVSQAEELRSLADTGIEAIGLTRTLTGQTAAEDSLENVVSATAELVRTDGTSGIVGDVEFAYLEQHTTVTEGGWEPVDGVDRSARDEYAYIKEIAKIGDRLADELTPQSPVARPADARLVEARSPQVASPPPSEMRAADATSDLHRSNGDTSDEILTDRDPSPQSALHASLDSIARRRLQMVDAMASFSAEGASALELRPQRHVDARTLELLTAVSGVRSAA